MDLVAGAKNVLVMTQHLTKENQPKLLKKCTLPLTGRSVVTSVYTNYAKFNVTDNGLKVIDMNKDIDYEFLVKYTEAKIFQ